MKRLVRYTFLFGSVLLLASCAGKPPLPKHAAIERGGTPAAGTDYRALVADAEVIYFPQERAASGGKSEPAALLLEAVQQSGKPFAIAWDSIDATQQALLDELQIENAPRDELIRKLELTGTSRAREHCRSVLRELRAKFVAVRLPPAVADKLAAGGVLNGDEQQLLPTGFAAPTGGYRAFAESRAARAGGDDRALAAAYRAEAVQRQFAAEQIVHYFRAAGSDTKLVVFAPSADFADDTGVPFYVAQKINVRQLVLGREHAGSSRESLLAFLRGSLRGRLQIVDRAPRSAHD